MQITEKHFQELKTHAQTTPQMLAAKEQVRDWIDWDYCPDEYISYVDTYTLKHTAERACHVYLDNCAFALWLNEWGYILRPGTRRTCEGYLRVEVQLNRGRKARARRRFNAALAI
jgi:hypothetical protein